MARRPRNNGSLQELADRLHSTAIHVLRLVRGQDSTTGIGPAQLSALSVIVFAGPISLKDLAGAEQVKAPTMSRIADALQRAGLVRRLADRQDRRAVLIRATPKGTALLHKGRKRRVEFLASYLERLNYGELKEIEKALKAVQEALQRSPSVNIDRP